MSIETLFSLVGWTMVVVVLAWLVISCIRIVKHQTVMIVESFGTYHATLKPGLHLLIPIMHNVRAIMDLRIQEIKASVDIKTSDNAFVELPIALQISVNPDNAEDAFYKLDNPGPQITSWILNSVRSITSDMTLQELYSDKEKLITEVRSLLVDKLRSFGYSIDGILVDQPQIDPQMEHAFNRIITAKREAEAAEQEAVATMTREVAKAKAEAESQRLRAKGMADSREILAKGLAESIAKLENHNVDPELSVKTLLELSRLDTIKDAATHGNTMIFDMSSELSPQQLLPLVAADKHKS